MIESRINDRNGIQLTKEAKVKERWKEYFEELLSLSEDREVEVTTLRMGVGSKRRVKLGQIGEKEVVEAVVKMQFGNAVGMDGINGEMIRTGE